MRISWDHFKRALKAANPRLVLDPGPTSLGAMVYFRASGHEDVVERSDLVELFAIASPSFFPSCPAFDVEVEIGSGKTRRVRGYVTFFRLLARLRSYGQPLVDKKRLQRVLPSCFQRFDAQRFKEEVRLRNTEAMPLIYKKARWLKDRSRPLPGCGQPLGWRRAKNYSFPDIKHEPSLVTIT